MGIGMGDRTVMNDTIAVLTPSRGRPDGLADAVHSLLITATRPGRVRVQVALDPDDLETLRMVMPWDLDFITAPERYGYGRLWRYFNDLTTKLGRTAEWYLLFNDDAVMTTHGWDDELLNLPDRYLVADFHNHHSPGLVTFPAVRRRALDYFGGRFVPDGLETVHVDSVWQELGRRSGTMSPTLVSHIEHRRPDLTGQQPDATFLEGRRFTEHERFFSAEFQRRLNNAALIIQHEECAR
jgi:hypothetical protein